METVKLDIQQRDAAGKGAARRLRAAGGVPAVVYGRGQETVPITIDVMALREALHDGTNVVLELHFPKQRGKKHHAVIKEIQRHPTRHHIVHLDLHEVDLKDEIEAPVPVELEGTPHGVVDGGVLDFQRHEIHVRALPTSVPTVLTLGVAHLGVGDYARVSDLAAPEGVTILDEPETVLVAILAPRLIVEAEEELAEAEAAEAEAEAEGAAEAGSAETEASEE